MRRVARLPAPTSLGAKLVLTMTAVGIAGALAITVLLAAIITPRFETLEAKATAGYVARTRAALAEYAAEVGRAAYDATAAPRATDGAGMHGMAYVAPDSRVVVVRWRDPVSGGARPATRTAFKLTIGPADLQRGLAGRRSSGFYARIGDRVAAIGVAPMRGSDGAAAGYVVMARTVDARQMSDLLRVTARIDPATASGSVVTTRTGRTVSVAVPMTGANGHAVAAVRFDVRSDVLTLGRRMLMLAVAGSTLLLLIVLIVLRRLIAHLVLRPLRRVERHMQRVTASGSLALFDEETRGDEIGALGRSLNTMLRQLKDLRERIEVQSFDLGRSESAVAVMHNVRNALNPISTILSQGIAQAPPIDRATLDRAIAELANDDIPAARRRKLAAFVAAAVQAQDDDRQATRRELGIGREALAHVLTVIGEQQEAAHERPTLEICDVTDIIARNATIARYLQGASIAFSFPSAPHHAVASRVILSQVIGNLFVNAAESIAACGDSGMIAATVREERGRLRIEIRDDGEGFAREVGARLFQRGFSTRAHKSGGLGLHWCANAMNAMDGSLRLESDGVGMGAVAILTLPTADAMVHAA